MDNTYTHEQRVKLRRVLESTVLNRVVQAGFILDIGTPWHVEDARHWLHSLPHFKYLRFDAMDMLWPEIYVDPLTGITWGWPKERLEAKRKSMSEMEFGRQFRCQASSSTMAIFKAEPLQRALNRGKGMRLGRPAPRGAMIVSGVDLAISKRESADKTVICTGFLNDNAEKEILDIRAGHWELNEIAKQVIDVVRRYPTHLAFLVESNAAQAYLLQALKNVKIMKALGATTADLERIRVFPHFTTGKKYDPLVGIRALEADFEHDRVRLPSDNGSSQGYITDLVTGLRAWDPMAHTSDFVMAYYLFCEVIKKYFATKDGTFADVGVW